MKSRASYLVNLLKEKGLTIGSVESMTGGMFASEITSINGASEVFKGSLVTYSPFVKENVCHVNKETIEKNGVVSYEVASEMAYRGREILDVDFCISVTGNAGPTSDIDNKPVGMIYISIMGKDYTWGLPLNLKGERNQIRQETTFIMIDFLIKTIESIF